MIKTYQTEDWEVNPIGTAKRLKRLEAALISINANSAPDAISLTPKLRIEAFYEISEKALNEA